MQAYAAILFDFDYTLADSSRGVYGCVNEALMKLGYDKAPKHKTDMTIGMSLQNTFRYLTGCVDADKADKFIKYFMGKADEIMVGSTYILPHAGEVIRDLAVKGCRLGIISTKYRHRIESILKRDGLYKHFEVIVGGEDVKRHKPDPEGIFKAVGYLGCGTGEVLYVGDNIIDEKAAVNAGVDFCAVLTGMTKKEQFDLNHAKGIFDDISGLYKWLKCGEG